MAVSRDGLRCVLHEHLEEQGLTQGEVAADAGLNRTHLCKIARGLKNPTLRTALAIAGALGVYIEDLWSIED